ncbi:hypothetical protein Bpfe_002551, partial [Biomphalaria pfeifferi]
MPSTPQVQAAQVIDPSQNIPTISTSTQAQSSIKSHVTTEETINAEILWALKVVCSHYSFNSCHDIADYFALMFPDSNIAKKMSCGKDKISYLVSFGLGPYFQDLLKVKLKTVNDGFVLLYDESLNRELNKKQMDMHVRYWDTDKVVTRYYGSAFLGHATAQDMHEKLCENFHFDGKSVVQISMDGPNVNWALFKLLSEDLQKASEKKFVDIGSCGLHTMHNAFRAGLASTGWELGHLFSLLSWLFKDTPARREDFTSLTCSSDFPLEHCQHRWVENVEVAKRALK